MVIHFNDDDSIDFELSETQFAGIIKLLGLKYNDKDDSITMFSDKTLKNFIEKTIGKWEEADSSQTLTCVDPQIDGGTSIPKRVRRRKYKSGFHILKDKPKRLGPFGYLYEVEYDKGTVIGKDRTVTTGASGVDCIIAQRMRIIRKI